MITQSNTGYFFKSILFLSVLFLQTTGTIQAQRLSKKKLLANLLQNSGDSLLKAIARNPAKYQVQILYTQINRTKKNEPRFTSYTFQINPQQYFYPASTVKLPGALVALDKLNNLAVPGLTKYTPLKIDSAYKKQTRVLTDSTSETGKPSIAHYIKKVLLTSDNDAYNRLYEFVGQQQLNETLHRKGYPEVRLIHRLSVGDGEERARYTNPITFYDQDKIIYQQPQAFNPVTYPNKLSTTLAGKGYMQNGQLVNSPMDFSDKNYITVPTLQNILKSVMFPEAMPAAQRFNLTPDDYAFLYKHLSMLPRESKYPKYDTKEFYDSYVKFFMFGSNKNPMPQNIRIFNKIGLAYGYMIDNAYIVDVDNKVEFLLTAVILGNEDGIFNDDKYEYYTVDFPFMAKLGNLIYQHELARRKKHLPNLDKFKISYK